jgi:hypothetical protein
MGLLNYSPERPLLLLTDYEPETPGGGAVILRSLLRPGDRERIVWLTLARPANPSADGPGATVFLKQGSAGRGRRRSLFRDSTVLARALADEVLDEARRRNARAIWAVMHGAVVPIVSRIARAGAWPLHLTVHDDPAFGVALRSRRYLVLVPWIEHQFAAALRRAGSVDVVSEGMAQRYRRRYGARPVIVHRGMEPAIEPTPRYDRSRGLRVGVLGNTYGYRQLLVLGRAVARAARQLGVMGRLVVIGRSFGERLRADLADLPDVEIEVTGHLDEPEGVRLLRDCFVLYLNYPFSPRDAVLRQTSFPTKLSTYLLAARPILLHAPGDSSVVPLAEYDGYALLWESLREEEGADRIIRLWNDPNSAESQHLAAERVRQRYYDIDRNRRVLFEALEALAGPLPG